MRNIICCFIIFCSATAGLAQSVTTMWPYKYQDFRNGMVYFKDQQALSAQLNIHLLKSTLHYLKDGKILEIKSNEIDSVLFYSPDNQDKYYMSNNQLMRVLNDGSTAFVAELILADISGVKESGGAYGSSSNVQSTRKLSSLEIGGVGNVNHMELKSKKDEGSLIPVTKKYFIVVEDKLYPATSKGIESQLPDDKKEEFKQFVKKQKINWKNTDSLIKLLEFFK